MTSRFTNIGFALALLSGAHAVVSHGAFLGMACAALLAAGSAILLAPAFAAPCGLLAGAIAATPVVAAAYAYAPLSAGEWMPVVLLLITWCGGAALIAYARTVSLAVAAPAAFVIALFLIGSVPSLQHKLDPVTWQSFYLTMSDGTKIATDLYLPRGTDRHKRVPTVLRQIRYYRAIALRWPFNIWVDERPEILERVVAQNRYAAVITDVRGSGASFGYRTQEWSPREVRDGYEIANWIVAQTWSNGAVGTAGGSYDGTAATFLIGTGNRAVQAGILMFCAFDAYTDVGFPGGINLRWFTDNWGRSLQVLDSNTLPRYMHSALVQFVFLGVKRVDADADGSQLRAAVAEHRKNYDASAFARDVTYRDQRSPRGLRMDDLSPFGFISTQRRLRIPTYNVSGWFDGAYQHAAIKRFLNARGPGTRLLIGPWDHGARNVIDPFERAPPFDLAAEMLRFFDRYVKGENNGIDAELPVKYYTIGEGRWHSSRSWPPAADTVTLYFGQGHTLTTNAISSGADRYDVDLSSSTGIYARWNSLSSAGTGRTGYFDRREQDKKLLVYQSTALRADTNVTGDPLVTLRVQSSTSDGEFFCYLEDVDPQGRVYYVTEGELRAIDRRMTLDPIYTDTTPQHSYRRADAQPLVQGKITTLEFDLLPTSWLFRKGHAIRIALAGADKGHFALPVSSATWHVRWGLNGSHISLPILHT